MPFLNENTKTIHHVVLHADRPHPIPSFIPEEFSIKAIDFETLLPTLHVPKCLLLELNEKTLKTDCFALQTIRTKSPHSKIITYSTGPSPHIAAISYQHETYFHVGSPPSKTKITLLLETAFSTLQMHHEIQRLSSETIQHLLKPMHPLKVLIVDPEKEIFQRLNALLTPTFTVHTIHHSQSAFARLKNTPYDVIIVDSAMPGLTHYDAISQFKRIDPQLDIVIHTKQNPDVLLDTLMSQGATGFIQKPAQDLNILFTLFQAADHHRTRTLLTALDQHQKIQALPLESRIHSFLKHYTQKRAAQNPVLWEDVEQILPELRQHKSFVVTFLDNLDSVDVVEKTIKSQLRL